MDKDELDIEFIDTNDENEEATEEMLKTEGTDIEDIDEEVLDFRSTEVKPKIRVKNSHLPTKVEENKSSAKSVILGILIFSVLIVLFVVGIKYLRKGKEQTNNTGIQVVKVEGVQISVPSDIEVVVNTDNSLLVDGHIYTPVIDDNGNITAYKDKLGVLHTIEDLENNRIVLSKDDINVLSSVDVSFEKPSSIEIPTITTPSWN